MELSPKQKAKELVKIFGKKLAIKYVNATMEEIKLYMESFYIQRLEYWQKVKSELKKLK